MLSLFSSDPAGEGPEISNEPSHFWQRKENPNETLPLHCQQKKKKPGLAYCLFVRFKKSPAVAACSGTGA